jgi:hypothetical protein
VRQESAVFEQLGRDLGIGCAADVEEQACVIDLRSRLIVDPQPLAQAHRDKRALQAVLKGQSHAEIRGEAQRRNHLSGTDLVPAGRGLAWHVYSHGWASMVVASVWLAAMMDSQ